MAQSFFVSGLRRVLGCSTTSADMVYIIYSGFPGRLLKFCIVNALKQYTCARVWVKLDSVREMYQMGIGAHPDQSMSHLVHSDCYIIYWGA